MSRLVAETGNPRVLRSFDDPRGRLVPIDFGELPFAPNRVFVVVGPAGPAKRGGHDAGCRQCMVLVSGSAVLRLRSQRSGARTFELCEPGEMALIEPDDFVSYDLLDTGAIVLVLADEPYRGRTDPEG